MTNLDKINIIKERIDEYRRLIIVPYNQELKYNECDMETHHKDLINLYIEIALTQIDSLQLLINKYRY